jgi:hypothetical protein
MNCRGLKPRLLCAFDGTAEAVPFQNMCTFTPEAVPFQNMCTFTPEAVPFQNVCTFTPEAVPFLARFGAIPEPCPFKTIYETTLKPSRKLNWQHVNECLLILWQSRRRV